MSCKRHLNRRSTNQAGTLTLPKAALDTRFTVGGDAVTMIDPYDPPYPDGPTDPEDIPMPLASSSWLDDDDSFDEEWASQARRIPE
jgi:hypothetical protein